MTTKQDEHSLTPMNEKDSKLVSENLTQDEAWAGLSQDWQTQDVPKTDISALVKQTRRRTYGAKLIFALNILATLGLFLGFIYGIYDKQFGQPFNTYLGIGALLSVIFVYFEVKIRVATWRQLCDSPEKAIDNAILASHSAMKYMQMTKISFVPFSLLINWFIYMVGESENKGGFWIYFTFNGAMLITYLIVDVLYRRRKRQHQHLTSLKAK